MVRATSESLFVSVTICHFYVNFVTFVTILKILLGKPYSSRYGFCADR